MPGDIVRPDHAMPSRPLPAFVMRDMLLTDLNRILSDWLTHYRPRMLRVPKDVYSVGMQKRIARHAKRNKILLAVDPDPEALPNKRDILGWICFKPWADDVILVHYMYVRCECRDQGLGRALLAAAGWRPGMWILSGHDCALPRALRRRYGFSHNPFLLEEVSEWA